MYYLKKRLVIAGAHSLRLDYASKCSTIHGHNWVITIFCKRDSLDQNKMIIDFAEIKKKVSDVLDHQYLNDILEQPTAESLAKFVYDIVPCCYRVEVEESEGNMAAYEES